MDQDPAIKIFLSYRRADTAGFVGRLYEGLAQKYGDESVFMDLRDIEPGEAFPEEIRAAAASAKVFLVAIGSRWISIEDDQGNRRLDDPDDWVVAEIQSALGSDGDVLPVLLEGAKVPDAARLPPSIQGLVARQSVELTPDRWEEDSRRLHRAIDRCLLGKRRRPPLTWALLSAAAAILITMLAWSVDLTAVPGLRWTDRMLENGLARWAPATLAGEVWLIEVDDTEMVGSPAARRARYTELLDTLTAAGTATAALDVEFDWQRAGGGDTPEDAGLVASIERASSSGTVTVLGTAGLPHREELGEGGLVLRSPVPAWLEAVIGDRWGHICPGLSPTDGSPFLLIEIARLQHDPAGRGRSGELWPTLALRTFMEIKGAETARFDSGDSEIRLLGPTDALLGEIPVDRVQQPSRPDDECLDRDAGFDLLMVTLRLLDADGFLARTRSAADREVLLGAAPPIVVLGSLREEPNDGLWGLRGYQVHAQTIVDLLSGGTVRRGGLWLTLAPLTVAALAGGLWRRRKRRPLAISDAPTPHRHWLLSAVDLVIVTLLVTLTFCLAAIFVFNNHYIVLGVPYITASCIAAYTLLALAERRRLT